MKILVCEPGKQPYPKDIPDTLEAKQEIVGGLIEPIYFEPEGDAIAVCNEEFLYLGFAPNRIVNGQLILGTFFICGDGENKYGERDFCSLTDEQIAKYTEQFALTPLIVFCDISDEADESEEGAPSQT